MGSKARLNWGSGPDVRSGWTNTDRIDWNHPDLIINDIRAGLPFPDEHFDGVVANHSLQCLTKPELGKVVPELHRVLKTGGLFRVLVPNIYAAIKAWERCDSIWPGFAAIKEPISLEEKFCQYLTWGGTNRTCFTSLTLGHLLLSNGFTPFPSDDVPAWLEELDSRLDESIAMTVSKP